MEPIHHNPDVIRAWREEAGLSQKELASAVHTSRPTIARVEAGKVHVSIAVIATIAARFQKPLAAALTDESRQKFTV